MGSVHPDRVKKISNRVHSSKQLEYERKQSLYNKSNSSLENQPIYTDRSNGFEVLKNPNSKKQNPVHSKMCMKILSNQECHSRTCNYAHVVEELKPVECVFKNQCKFKKSSKCEFIHPNETLPEFLQRLEYVKEPDNRNSHTTTDDYRQVVSREPIHYPDNLQEVITIHCTTDRMYDMVPVLIDEGFKNIHIHLIN
jgi:hypothetical protein